MWNSKRRCFTKLILILLSGLILTLTPAWLVQSVWAAEQPKPEPATTVSPEIPPKQLQHLVTPLTLDDLKVEVDGWIGVLKQHASLISQKKIEAMKAEGEAKAKLLDEVNKLQEQQTALIDRAKVVVEELRAKGGEVANYDKYLKALSGIKVDMTDAGGSWKLVRGWLTSKEGGIRWLKNLILFIVTLVVFIILSRILGSATRRAVVKLKGVSELLKDFMVNVVHKLVFLIGLVVALSMLEINVGPFLAAIGAVGFIVGFALQGTLSNFAAGFMILLYRPYDIGDYVNVAGISGTVSVMTLVSTTLTLPDNQTVVIPNNSIWGGIITNVTGSETRRIDMVFGIGYEDDISKAQRILEEVVKDHPLVLPFPEPVIRVNELADSSVNFICRPWVKTEDYWTTYWDLTRQVKEEFDRNGISIPFPQREVHLRQLVEVKQGSAE
ncbi:mechanosensitive ion channel family protein [Desulfoferrobacter suflitae]|uniref:mechanosensitive ion channel family protein n=1 Tax=Desulfoferrobacter suflitae TaxID=2865782 RepID=UPI002164AB17|nr:mechanosensitive ion channel family protein [Desulfoferrobacter suflitae]MCK8601797.1 mechanosensitive ion channel family protein [Desulfoferrobacter suflitae]